jgi:hypothetical protein
MIKKTLNIVLLSWFLASFIVMALTTGEGPLWEFMVEISKTNVFGSALFMLGMSGCPLLLALINSDLREKDHVGNKPS